VCSFVPDDSRCAAMDGSGICDPELGCVECYENKDCAVTQACTTATCDDDNRCSYSGCPPGQKCCLLRGCLSEDEICLSVEG
jgi:hypothetical protein